MKKSRALLQVEDAQQSANKTIDQYDREIAAATRAATDLTRENQLIDRTLKNINGSNIRDLEYSLKMVNEQLRNTSQGDARCDVMTEKARKLKNEIDKINEAAKPKEEKSIFSRGIKTLNENWGAITQI